MFKHLTTILLLLIACNGFAQQKRYSFSQPKMGSPFEIIFYADNDASAKQISDEAFALVDSLVFIFSDYIDSSELNKLSASAGKHMPVKVSPAMLELLLLSKDAFEKSKGSFDITIGPLSLLWRKARKQQVFPGEDPVKKALQHTGFNNITIDSSNMLVELQQPGMRLDAGGIAQGYIAQKVINFLSGKNIGSALVNASGDIVASAAPPASNGWKIGINRPEEKEALLKVHLVIANMAVTTSGDVYQFIEHDGKRYSHIIDPRSGYGITTQKNVTVIAADGTVADWLTKACSILPVRRAKKLATSLHAALLVNQLKGKRIVSYTNKLYRAFPKQ